jgi:hypothetical protein
MERAGDNLIVVCPLYLSWSVPYIPSTIFHAKVRNNWPNMIPHYLSSQSIVPFSMTEEKRHDSHRQRFTYA